MQPINSLRLGRIENLANDEVLTSVVSEPDIAFFAPPSLSTSSPRSLSTMLQLPLADTAPPRVTDTLFKGLVFALIEPQDIPDGARTLHLLRASLPTTFVSVRL